MPGCHLDTNLPQELAIGTELQGLVSPHVSDPHSVVAVHADHVGHVQHTRTPLAQHLACTADTTYVDVSSLAYKYAPWPMNMLPGL
jgi:hypothetical protein